jgi:general secretion pathway protein D/MSHA biogenesis protein MshL
LPLVLSGCGTKPPTAEVDRPQADGGQVAAVTEIIPLLPPAQSLQLPVRYQRPGFFIPEDEDGREFGAGEDEFVLKVGANISSARGPQPLREVVKRLVTLKGMSVSWASDVGQSVLVDVNIRADDGFFEAIDNLLRQVDYFHEVEGNTVIVKYRMTAQFFIAIPYMKGTYTTTIGGDFLTNRETSAGTEGTVKITSDGNEFDVWSNITENLDMIFSQWAITEVSGEVADPAEGVGEEEVEEVAPQITRRLASGDSYYMIDRSVGLITVVAPLAIVERVESYLDLLKTELYRQVVIEARIIEVFLKDNSRIGLDWSQVLKDFGVGGIVTFGGPGGVPGAIYADSGTPRALGEESIDTPGAGSFINTITLRNVGFNVMLNALNEQGEATVLSSPKITVLNGQPAVLSVGTDTAFIEAVETTIEEGIVTNAVTVGSVVDGISLGVLASIIDDDTVILHLTPITTEIVDGEIREVRFGANSRVGLPEVRVRQMSTMVKVNNGEMLIIGGLIDSIERDTSDFAPIVGSIPFIKYLFGVEEKIKEKRELVILLTPRVI